MRRRDGEARVEYKGDWEEESSVGHASGVIRGEGSGHSDNDEAIVGNRNMAQCDIRKWKWECEIRTFRAENRLGEGRGHKRKLIFMAGIGIEMPSKIWKTQNPCSSSYQVTHPCVAFSRGPRRG